MDRRVPALKGSLLTEDSLSVVRGAVLRHSKDRDEVYRKARELKPAHSAILFFGHLPKDAAIVYGADLADKKDTDLEGLASPRNG